MSLQRLTATLALALLVGCSATPAPQPEDTKETPSKMVADTVYTNGTVITVDASGTTAEAVAVQGGKIVAVGSASDMAKFTGESTKTVDLGGKTLTPGFIDGHGHFLEYPMLMGTPNISSPPVGPNTNIPQLIETLKTAAKTTPADLLLFGMGYDDSLLEEQRHPTRQDLDAITTHAVCLIHVSGHLSTCNSKGLAKIGVKDDAKDPEGGVIRRDEKGIPNGVLEEKAMYPLFTAVPRLSIEETLKKVDQAAEMYASYGITTAQDGATLPTSIELIKAIEESHPLAIDVVAYPNAYFWAEMKPRVSFSREYKNGVRYGGLKILQDGSPQGKTAYLSKAYKVPPEGLAADYRGYPIFPQEKLDAFVDEGQSEGFQVLTHCNGDAAADMFIESVRKAQAKHGKKDLRHVVIHAQTAREDQIDAFAELSMVPSFFVSHTFFWGDWHRDSVLGEERASRISPLASAGKRGIRYNIHNDSPVVPPDMMRLMWTAVARKTRTDKVLGEAQRVSPIEALRAMTIDAAYAYHEEDSKGSIEVGKRADLVILDKNPLTVPTDDIKDIRVLQTIKDGKTVFGAE